MENNYLKPHKEIFVKEKVLNFNKYCNMLKQKAMESEEAKGNAFIVIMIQQEFNKEFGDFEKWQF